MSGSGGLPEPTWYTTELAETWEDIEARHKWYSHSRWSDCYWIFRGDNSCRGCSRNEAGAGFENYGVPTTKSASEMEMIREFQRKAGLYLDREPDKDDVLEWLALMRHYGAPTRLTDWTYSVYVAVHFALADDLEGAVWSFNAAQVNRSDRVKKAIADNLIDHPAWTASGRVDRLRIGRRLA
jgi:hypothetical protein